MGDYILAREIVIKVMIRQIITQQYARRNEGKAHRDIKGSSKGLDLIWEVKDLPAEETLMLGHEK